MADPNEDFKVETVLIISGHPLLEEKITHERSQVTEISYSILFRVLGALLNDLTKNLTQSIKLKLIDVRRIFVSEIVEGYQNGASQVNIRRNN